ncbi:MAG: PAS domain S-box protein, partial [Anaerolineae bacterium]|nr:PAS domain S-box protein [Anaerolineae bacterium]
MSSKFTFALWLAARFVMGGLFLCSFSFLQKLLLIRGARFQLTSYIVPFIYGGFSMMAICYLERKRRELAIEKLVNRGAVYAQRARESQERNAELVRVNQKSQAEIARNRWVTRALRESEDKFRTMYEASAVGIVRVSLDFRITQANSAYIQMLGYSMEELRGKKIAEITHPEDVPANMKQQTRLGRGEIESYRMRKRFIHQDGRTVWGLSNANLIRDEEGKPAHFMGNVIDITAQVRAEQSLRESEGRFAAFMDRFPGAVFIKDAASRYVYLNSYYQEVFGFKERPLGKTPAEVWPPEMSREMAAEDEEVLDQGYQVVATRLPDKDGGERYYETHKFLIPRPDQPPLLGGIALDITARVQAEEEIRRLGAVIEQTPVTVVITDLDGNISYANPYFERSTGYTVAEALGQNHRILKSDQQDDAFYKNLWDTITAGHTWQGTFINRRKDGELYHEEATIFPLKNVVGETTNYAVIKQDITARVRAEEQQARLLAQQVAINELALALGRTRDLDQLYCTIYQYVQTLMDAWTFIISFYDDEIQLIQAGYVMLAGTQLDVTNFSPIPMAEPGWGIQSQVIRSGEPLYIPDHQQALAATRTGYHVYEDGTVSAGLPPPAEMEEPVTQSALYVPLKIAGETIGVLQVQSAQLDAYYQEDIALLTGVANVAAVAIQNARLLEQISQQARQIEQTINAVPEGVLLLDAQSQIVLVNPLGKKDLAALSNAQVGEELTHLNGTPLADFFTSVPGGGWHELRLEGERPQYFELLARPLEPGTEQQGWVLVIREVTRQREARTRTRRQERLAAIGQL